MTEIKRHSRPLNVVVLTGVIIHKTKTLVIRVVKGESSKNMTFLRTVILVDCPFGEKRKVEILCSEIFTPLLEKLVVGDGVLVHGQIAGVLAGTEKDGDTCVFTDGKACVFAERIIQEPK